MQTAGPTASREVLKRFSLIASGPRDAVWECLRERAVRERFLPDL
jgi:hypothetical protein